ncbi:p26-b [Ectropis obliqua nucleopolyhedrovirus]|uniref:Protein p26 n=1 Tax=Ectropis obliqua nucleopolyhedrovirus TaxID=59376 RepID=A0EYV5_9ABAC|nr:p26-b [Ectropis obliqua nucleopolyhedrovirus]ABI35735.1 p26-b [Ectropis obliqua nucleopolyhedrovirus]AGS47908.1 protein p26 [Ectropis obliqua nucleopolyhedrovirus]QWV59679.1 p26-b [Ectropis obliqua nucleopolyhedrovirus]UYO72850.1 p26-b [Ectropis obliqua nucleopolyhedrovirus]
MYINVKNVMCKVDFVQKRVNCESYNGVPLLVHIFKQYDASAEWQNLHQYPGLASSMVLPKIAASSCVQIVKFDVGTTGFTTTIHALDVKLYYVHHRYGKHFVYGLVPAIVSLQNDLELYTGAPIFNNKNNLISFVTDSFLSDINELIVPVTSESHRMQGMFCVTGCVKVFSKDDDIVDLNNGHINIFVKQWPKYVEIFVMYNGFTMSYVKLVCKFAANVLIV